MASFLPAFQSLLDLTVLLAQGSPPASLAPFVQELDEGRWGLLSNRSGTMRIRYVDLEQGMLVAAPPEVDARIGEWLDAKLEPAFGGVVVREDGKLLLRESAGYPQYPQKLWSLAKGRPRVGETPQETAIRSVREESGAEARVVARIPGTFPGTTTENAYFLMELVKDHETFNTKETRSVRWVEFDEAEALVRSGDGARAWERNLAVLAAARRLYASLHSTRRPESP